MLQGERMICNLSVGILSAGANLSLFGMFCHKDGIAGENVIEMLKNISIFVQ